MRTVWRILITNMSAEHEDGFSYERSWIAQMNGEELTWTDKKDAQQYADHIEERRPYLKCFVVGASK